VTGSGMRLSLMVVQPRVDVMYCGLMTYEYRTFLDWWLALEYWSAHWETCHSAILSTTNLTWAV